MDTRTGCYKDWEDTAMDDAEEGSHDNWDNDVEKPDDEGASCYCCDRSTGSGRDCTEEEVDRHYWLHTWEECCCRHDWDWKEWWAGGVPSPSRKSWVLLQCVVPFYRGGAELVSSFELVEAFLLESCGNI